MELNSICLKLHLIEKIQIQYSQLHFSFQNSISSDLQVVEEQLSTKEKSSVALYIYSNDTIQI